MQCQVINCGFMVEDASSAWGARREEKPEAHITMNRIAKEEKKVNTAADGQVGRLSFFAS